MEENKKVIGIPNTGTSFFCGVSTLPSHFIRFIPENQEGDKNYRVIVNLEDVDAIKNHAVSVINEMISKLKENGFDSSNAKHSVTRFEKIGDTVFPVTYDEKGIVVDYPTKLK